MQNILIIYPHWPPSNLAGVHRARLIANYLHDFNWHPIVLTVHPDYYEEKLDWDMQKTVNKNIEVVSVKASKVSKIRIIGDIGLRAFSSLKKEALKIINERAVDFVWIPIPSFYVAILGRILFEKTKVSYGIDYIDPWVRDISNRKNLRAILSNIAARILEPYAIKKAALISGVSEPYYLPTIERNFKKKKIQNVAMPYGFDKNDHKIKIENLKFPWDNHPGCIPFLYAGAFLPKSDYFIDLLFKAVYSIKNENRWNKKWVLFFIGTGNYLHKSITNFAIENKVEESVVEIRERFPYLNVLNFLAKAKGVMLIGSTEKHYTASKTYQSLLSGQPVFSILHTESSAVKVFEEADADDYLCKYNPSVHNKLFFEEIKKTFYDFIEGKKECSYNDKALDKYSAKESTRTLIKGIENVL